MIPSIHIENYKCFRDFDIDFGDFTVLVGPNGSGKTALMECLQLVGSLKKADEKPKWGPVSKDDVWRNNEHARLLMRVPMHSREDDSESAFLLVVGQEDVRWKFAVESADSAVSGHIQVFSDDAEGDQIAECIGRVEYYSLDPRSLKSPSESRSGHVLGDRGRGFPGFLDNFLRMDRKRYFEFEKEFYTRFPSYKEFNLPLSGDGDSDSLSIRFWTVNEEQFSATSVSDGEILSLAYLALCYQPKPPSVLLVEEPENGVHHARLREIIDTLKYLSSEKNVQVILTTHSPYLLDLVEPEDVRVFWKDEEGAAHARPLSDLPDIAAFKKHFMTGEIWTSFPHDELVAKLKGE